MMAKSLRAALAAAALLFIVVAAFAAQTLPAVTSRVTDVTGTLTAAQRSTQSPAAASDHAP